MKDVDFDELDRAVNSLMGGNDSQPQSSGGASPVVSSDNSGSGFVNDNSNIESVNSVERLNRAPLRSAAVHSPHPTASTRGRYMDMVRPGNVIPRPGRDTIREEVSEVLPDVNPQPSVETINLTESNIDNVAQNENSGSDGSAFENPSNIAQEGAAGELSEDNTDSTSEDKATSESLSSPFLENAVVQKRPLGRPQEPLVAQETDSLSSNLTPSNSDSATTDSSRVGTPPLEKYSLAPKPQGETEVQLPEQPLPAELGSELLSIESNSENSFKETGIAELSSSTSSTFTESTPSAPSDKPKSPITLGSIAQQYKVNSKPSADEPTGVLYNEDAIQAGVKPVKSKSSLVTILLIVGIILLGIVGGVVVYYLGIL